MVLIRKVDAIREYYVWQLSVSKDSFELRCKVSPTYCLPLFSKVSLLPLFKERKRRFRILCWYIMNSFYWGFRSQDSWSNYTPGKKKVGNTPTLHGLLLFSERGQDLTKDLQRATKCIIYWFCVFLRPLKSKLERTSLLLFLSDEPSEVSGDLTKDN